MHYKSVSLQLKQTYVSGFGGYAYQLLQNNIDSDEYYVVWRPIPKGNNGNIYSYNLRVYYI